MRLSKRHQETFDEKFPNGYDAKNITKKNGNVVDESEYYHIMYIDIRKDGERTRDVPCMQKYSARDWDNTKKIFEESGIHVTGHSEYAVIHDPTAREAKAKPEKAEVKPEAKPKGRPPQKQS